VTDSRRETPSSQILPPGRCGAVVMAKGRPLRRWLVHVARGVGVLVALTGAMVFAGWMLGIAPLCNLTGGAIVMKTNAALGLLLAGAGLILLTPEEAGRGRRWAGRACGAMVLLLGALTFSEHLLGWNLGIDQLLATESPGAAGAMSPNRMGPLTAVDFCLLGPALLLLGRQGRRAGRRALDQSLALLVVLVAMFPTIGYLYGADEFYGTARYTGIAWPTAVAILALGLGILCARPQDGLMAAVTADDSGGRTIRLLLLPMILVPLGLGWLRLAGERSGFYEAAFGTALMMLIFIFIFSALSYHAGRRVSQSATVIEQQKQLLAVTLASIGDAVIVTNTQGRVTFINGEAERLTGWTATEAAGQPLDVVFRIVNEETRQSAESPVDRVLRLGTVVGLANHTVLIARDGRETPIDDSGAPIRQADGTVHGVVLVFRDFSDRRQAEEAIRVSEEKFALAFADNPAAVAMTRLEDGRFLEVNNTWLTLNGYSREEVIGLSARQLPIWPTAEGATRFVHELREEGSLHGWEQEFLRRSGEGFVAQLSAQILTVRGEQVILTTLVDITERKRAEAALREREQLLQDVIDGSTSPIFLKDRDGKFITINVSLERMLGMSREEIEGKTDYDVAPKEVADYWRAHDTKVMATGKAIQIEEVADLQDGHHVFLADKFPLVDADGRVYGVGAISHDITERKRAEEALAKSEQEFRTLAEAVPQIVWATRPDGWNIYFNQQWTDYTGLTLDESYGHGWNIPFHPDDKQRAWDAWQRAVQHDKTYLLECRLRRADGVYRWWLIHGSPIRGANGEIQKWIGTCTDIEELKQAEESLQQAKAAAEAANVAKSQFLANMSHELRTPMNAILGMIDVALPKATDPTVQDCLQTARGSADLLLTLLNDLLESAKIESGKLELESVPFSLRRMLDQITRVLAVRASEKGLCFYCRMPDDTPDAVVGDRMRLQQVLLNLAGNAIKFTELGDVEISLRALSEDGEACLEFAVRDTGIGIPPAGQERLFQPFSQADPSMTRRFGGTGLGLSISKSLVEMMGGRIWVESELGKGSTFYFTVRLPLAKELPCDFEAPAAGRAAACVQLRILLVEDNPANQKLATYILQDRGHVVEIAGDGQEAVYLTEQNRYDVILMDVQMPGMNGLKATAAIRHREDGDTRVPIIAMTAHAMKSDRDRCLAAGMDGYLSKPVNAQEMIGLVESLAGGVASVAQFAAATPSAADSSSQATAVVFNPEEALARCFNSKDMVREMIQCFLDDVANLFPQMRVALEKSDLVKVGRLGHRMKGTVVYLGAQPAKEAALRVERFCKSSGGTPSEAEEAINALEDECIVLKAALCEHPLAADLTRDDSH